MTSSKNRRERREKARMQAKYGRFGNDMFELHQFRDRETNINIPKDLKNGWRK